MFGPDQATTGARRYLGPPDPSSPGWMRCGSQLQEGSGGRSTSITWSPGTSKDPAIKAMAKEFVDERGRARADSRSVDHAGGNGGERNAPAPLAGLSHFITRTCVTLRLRFNLPQPGVLSILSVPHPSGTPRSREIRRVTGAPQYLLHFARPVFFLDFDESLQFAQVMGVAQGVQHGPASCNRASSDRGRRCRRHSSRGCRAWRRRDRRSATWWRRYAAIAFCRRSESRFHPCA